MHDRINWFQGWVIILMLFTGIAMLKHYEDRGEEQINMFQKQASAERALMRGQLDELHKQIEASRVVSVGCARLGQ